MKLLSHSNTFWESAIPTNHEYDVIVIGAGFTGLITAILLTKIGYKTLILEANNSLGKGASGRNSGFVAPALSRNTPSDIIKKYGTMAKNFIEGLNQSANNLFSLLQETGLDCGVTSNGWLQTFIKSAEQLNLTKYFNEWQQTGANIELLNKETLHSLTGSSRYSTGILFKEGGQLDPLKSLYALKKHFINMGGSIVLGEPVNQWEKITNNLLVYTNTQTYRAKKIIFTGNAYSNKPLNLNKNLIVKVPMLLAVFKLEHNNILASNIPISDTEVDFSFFRKIDNQYMMTGLLAPNHLTTQAIDNILLNKIKVTFNIELAASLKQWTGNIGLTLNGFPHLVKYDANVFGWTGCNGRGLCLSYLMAQSLTAAVDDQPILLPYSKIPIINTIRLQQLFTHTYLKIKRPTNKSN